MKTYFTSDTHFRHANIIKYCNRPWAKPEDFDSENRWISRQVKHSCADAMTEACIQNWNAIVTPDDEVYHIGDFAWGSTADVLRLLRRLNGKIKFIWGNHDDNLKQVSRIIDFYPDLKERIHFLGDYAEILVDGQAIILMHYAMRVWNGSHKGVWQFYGHSHGSLADDSNALAFDIGYDCHNYAPISMDTARKIMSKKTWKPIDHHGDPNKKDE